LSTALHYIFWGLLLFSTAARAEHNPCESLLQKTYLKNVAKADQKKRERMKKESVEAQPNLLVDADPGENPRKLSLLRTHEALLKKLMARGEFTLDQFRDAAIFEGEAFIGDHYRPCGTILVINNKLLAFDPNKPDQVEEIQRLRPGFHNTEILALRLDGQYVVPLLKNGSLKLMSAHLKDPAMIDKIIDSLEGAAREIYTEFKSEFREMLLTTPLTIADITGCDIMSGKIAENGAVVYIFAGHNSQFYLTQKAATLNPNNNKRYGIFEKQPMGFNEKFVRHIEFEDASTIRIVDNELDRTFLHSVETAQATIKQIAASSPVGQNLIAEHEVAILDLLLKGVLSPTAAELSTMYEIVHPLTEEKYTAFNTPKGFVAVGKHLPNQWAYIRDIDDTVPMQWRSGQGYVLRVRHTMGFEQKRVEEIVNISGPTAGNLYSGISMHGAFDYDFGDDDY
jgi:hypothetical protein